MNRTEYNIRLEEIHTLIEEHNYKDAADLADTIDWRRVKSVRTLLDISDVYRIVRRYKDSYALLKMAYEKRPDSKMILFAMTELCLKMNDIVTAWEYYKDYVGIAPDDSRRHVLLYKIYSAQEVSLDEQIGVLEKLKEEDYTDKWGYELALLYHRVGFATKCVEECDELITFFGEGKYVQKAMELKMLHQSLSPQERAKYMGEKDAQRNSGDTRVISDLESAMIKEMTDAVTPQSPTTIIPTAELKDFQVTTSVDAPYDAINLEKELAASMAQLMPEGQPPVWEGVVTPTPEEVVPAPEDMGPMVLTPTSEVPEVPDEEEVFFEDIADEKPSLPETGKIGYEDKSGVVELTAGNGSSVMDKEPPRKQSTYEESSNEKGVSKVIVPAEPLPSPVYEAEDFEAQKRPKERPIEDMLSQEDDGQLSFIMPEKDILEKQITGQITIQDYLREWEEMKKRHEEQLHDDISRQVHDKTDNLFAQYDKAAQESILSTLSALELGPDRDLEGETSDESDEVALEEDGTEDSGEESLGDDLFTVSGTAEAYVDPFLVEEYPEESIVEEALTEETDEVSEEEVAETAEEESEEVSDGIEYESDETVEEETDEESEEYPEEELFEDITDEPNESSSEKPRKFTKATRVLTGDEKTHFGAYVHNGRSNSAMIRMLDGVSLAAYTGNIIITGEMAEDRDTLIKNLVKFLSESDANFTGKPACISAEALMKKNPADLVKRVPGGALIVNGAGKLTKDVVRKLLKALQNETDTILVILADTKKAADRLVASNEDLLQTFNLRFDIEALSPESLASFGKKYAAGKDYAIDEIGMMALQSKIEGLQTARHSVTAAEVKGLIQKAIAHSQRKTLKHYFAVLFGKRYDEEDMIILREDDFQ